MSGPHILFRHLVMSTQCTLVLILLLSKIDVITTDVITTDVTTADVTTTDAVDALPPAGAVGFTHSLTV